MSRSVAPRPTNGFGCNRNLPLVCTVLFSTRCPEWITVIPARKPPAVGDVVDKVVLDQVAVAHDDDAVAGAEGDLAVLEHVAAAVENDAAVGDVAVSARTRAAGIVGESRVMRHVSRLNAVDGVVAARAVASDRCAEEPDALDDHVGAAAEVDGEGAAFDANVDRVRVHPRRGPEVQRRGHGVVVPFALGIERGERSEQVVEAARHRHDVLAHWLTVELERQPAGI